MTAPSSSSTNDNNTACSQVSAASPSVNTASLQVCTASVTDNTVYAFMVENLNGSNVLHQDLEAPRSKEGQFRNQDNIRKQGNNEDTSKAMLAIEGVGFDWSDMAEEQSFSLVSVLLGTVRICQQQASASRRQQYHYNHCPMQASSWLVLQMLMFSWEASICKTTLNKNLQVKSDGGVVNLIGDEDPTDEDEKGVSVSLGDEIFSEEKKSRESNIGGGTIAGRVIITWGGGIALLISESEGTIVE
ncbi:hypothetical protein Tco_0290377 [Tanacetum coccineum]